MHSLSDCKLQNGADAIKVKYCYLFQVLIFFLLLSAFLIAKLWNELPGDIVEADSFQLFKSKNRACVRVCMFKLMVLR